MEENCEKSGIIVNNIAFNYNYNNPVLSDVDVNVPFGKIYGLIGPSGSGKTTLLKCILGLLRPSSGSISVFGHKPNDLGSEIPGRKVGYMPQETGLHDDLNVFEMIYYFGKLYQLEEVALKLRIDNLIEYLFESNELKSNQLVSTLSGGQKKRLSLACALVHKPKLLILDEPTVSVDPLLQNKIWIRLKELSKINKTTIIMSTHYVEEVRKGDAVGFMRKGRIINEGAPLDIMNHYGTKDLTEIFFKMSLSDSAKNRFDNSDMDVPTMSIRVPFKQIPLNDINNDKKPSSKLTKLDSSDNQTSQKRIQNGLWNELKIWLLFVKIITWKKLVQSFRFYESLIFFTLFPFLTIIAVRMCFNIPKGLPVGLLIEEEPPFLSQIFIDHIDKEIISIKPIDSVLSGIEKSRSQELYGFLTIGANFSDFYLKKMFLAQDVLDNDNQTEWFNSSTNYKIDQVVIDASRIEFRGDITNKILNTLIFTIFQIALDESTSEMIHAYYGNESGIQNLNGIKIEQPVRGALTKEMFNIISDFIPGALLIICFAFSMCLCYMAFHREVTDSMLQRNLAAKVTYPQIVLSIVVSQSIIMFFQTVLAWSFAIMILDIKTDEGLFAVLLLFCLIIFNGCLQGVLNCVLSAQLFTAGFFALGWVTINIILTGNIWPVEAFPYYVKSFAQLLPNTWAVAALKSLITSGMTIKHAVVYQGLIANFVSLFVYLFLIFVLLLFKKKSY